MFNAEKVMTPKSEVNRVMQAVHAGNSGIAKNVIKKCKKNSSVVFLAPL